MCLPNACFKLSDSTCHLVIISMPQKSLSIEGYEVTSSKVEKGFRCLYW